jgi:hypothetical protein
MVAYRHTIQGDQIAVLGEDMLIWSYIMKGRFWVNKFFK